MVKKLLTILIASMTLPLISYASTVVQSNGCYPSTTCAFSSNITAGDVIIVTTSGNVDESATTLSDTLGNTYTRDTGGWNGFDGVAIFHTISASGGANTVTRSSGNDQGLMIMEVSGLSSSGLVNTTDLANTVGTGATPLSHSYTTTQTSFIVSALNNESTGGTSIAGTGYSIVQELGSQYGVVESKGSVTSGSYTNSFLFTGLPPTWIMATVAFKEVTASSTPVKNMLMCMNY